MKLEHGNNSVLMRPGNDIEKTICRLLVKGGRLTLVKRAESCLRFIPTNVIMFNHAELEIQQVAGSVLLRPKTKNAEVLCAALLSNGGYAIVEQLIDQKGTYYRFISTNPTTGNPWVIDSAAQYKDLTLGDDSRE